MIEIKNKRMILFPEDRLLGPHGDIMSSERKFILDCVQGGCDLSDMVCWIKLQPKTGNAFDQLIKKEIKGDKIILTWLLSGACLETAGELSAQIIFADKGYFNEKDLSSLDDGDLVVPSKISGVSAPVWQSHKEIFIVSESIDGTVPYAEVNKNVLVSALAQALDYSQKAMGYSQSAKTSELNAQVHSRDALSAKNESASYYVAAQEQAELSQQCKNEAEEYAAEANLEREKCEQISNAAQEHSKKSYEHSQMSYSYLNSTLEAEARIAKAEERIGVLAEDAANQALWAESSAISAMIIESEVEILQGKVEQARDESCVYAIEAEGAAEKAQDCLAELKKNTSFRLIYSKTLVPEDEGCISFEINQDSDGNPLSLSECVFYIYCPKTVGASGSYVKLEGLTEGNTSFARLSQFSLVSANNDVYCRAECQNRGRWIVKIAKGSDWNQNAESVTVQGAVCSQSRANDGKPLTAVRLVQHSGVGVPFASGMMVEVWGKDNIKGEA